jgi:hypothetical protein
MYWLGWPGVLIITGKFQVEAETLLAGMIRRSFFMAVG